MDFPAVRGCRKHLQGDKKKDICPPDRRWSLHQAAAALAALPDSAPWLSYFMIMKRLAR